MPERRNLLILGLAVPALYFGAVVLGGSLYSDYSHLSQYASELGMAGQASAPLFNGGIFLAGVAAIGVGMPLFRALSTEGGRRGWSGVAAVMTALFGVGLVIGALFPMPDPRHGAFGLGMTVHLAPLAVAVALWRAPGRRSLCLALIGVAIGMAIMLAVMFGVGGFVTRANVGGFQRVYALLLFGWIGLASWSLRSRPDSA